MKAEFKLVTPKIAQEFLITNIANRAVNVSIVKAYASELSKGSFITNGDSIRFDINGNLIDGQHRLLAIIMSGVSANILLVYGLPVEAFKTIDCGKKRSAADILKIEGVDNSTNISAGIRKYLALKDGTYTRKPLISNLDISSEYDLHSDLYQNLFRYSNKFYKDTYRIISPSDYLAFYRYFQLKYSNETIDSFFEKIKNKEGICGLLFEKLMAEIVSKRVLRGGDKTALIIKAFIYHATGKGIKQLRFSKEEKFPTILQ